MLHHRRQLGTPLLHYSNATPTKAISSWLLRSTNGTTLRASPSKGSQMLDQLLLCPSSNAISASGSSKHLLHIMQAPPASMTRHSKASMAPRLLPNVKHSPANFSPSVAPLRAACGFILTHSSQKEAITTAPPRRHNHCQSSLSGGNTINAYNTLCACVWSYFTPLEEVSQEDLNNQNYSDHNFPKSRSSWR